MYVRRRNSVANYYIHSIIKWICNLHAGSKELKQVLMHVVDMHTVYVS